ncbi:hypothetical protein Rsub_08172 [Raphidocelis subcapitata]|uniref:Uncharacterized protein n=1 Tax=Raphidocelis subcapitata TaxID=307507 RepID=A0A2V0P5S9_9CHLO|nr:hypothetical protein Rsub_08172 [Raphidocelis subcapitata]|eukprot:GBF94929.1 hypothetical protein Rsub_08172 [Raphidocelis subcapitata]
MAAYQLPHFDGFLVLVSTVNKALDEVESAMDVCWAEKYALMEEKDELEREIMFDTSTVDALQDQLAGLRIYIANQDAMLGAAAADCQTLREFAAELSAIVDAEALLAAAAADCQALRAYAARHDELNADALLDAAAADCQTLRAYAARHDALNADALLDAAADDGIEFRSYITKMERLYAGSQAQLAQLQRRLQAAETARAFEASRAAELQEQLRASEASRVAAETRAAKLQADVAALQRQVTDLEADVLFRDCDAARREECQADAPRVAADGARGPGSVSQQPTTRWF